MEDQISPELVSIYLEDARAHLEALDHCLLTLEREGLDLEVISTVLGPLHTLKGNSGMLGFSSIKDYVHRLEDVLEILTHLQDVLPQRRGSVMRLADWFRRKAPESHVLPMNPRASRPIPPVKE